VQDLPDVAGDSTQVAIMGGAVDVDDRLHVVVRHDRGTRALADGGHGAQQLGAPAAGDRHVGQFPHGIDAILRQLHDDRIGHAVLRVQPERRRGLDAAGKVIEHAGREVTFRQPHLARE
jgi:hypothetical protein